MLQWSQKINSSLPVKNKYFIRCYCILSWFLRTFLDSTTSPRSAGEQANQLSILRTGCNTDSSEASSSVAVDCHTGPSEVIVKGKNVRKVSIKRNFIRLLARGRIVKKVVVDSLIVKGKTISECKVIRLKAKGKNVGKVSMEGHYFDCQCRITYVTLHTEHYNYIFR